MVILRGYFEVSGKYQFGWNGDDVGIPHRLFEQIKERKIPAKHLKEIRLNVDFENESGTTLELVIVKKEGRDLKLDLEIFSKGKRWLSGRWQMAVEMEPEEWSGNRHAGTAEGSSHDQGKSLFRSW